MSEKVEQVAKALVDALFALDNDVIPWSEETETARDQVRLLARAAIEAIRKPTDAMQKVGAEIGDWCEGAPQSEVKERAWQAEQAKKVFTAMIDEALR